jgi:ParB/RepB/Spo0J family partition protein
MGARVSGPIGGCGISTTFDRFGGSVPFGGWLLFSLFSATGSVDIVSQVYHDPRMDVNQPKVQVVPIDQLKPWEKNPRKGHDTNAIRRSIKAFGYLSPIIVQAGSMRVLAGHGRLSALKKDGVKDVPVIIADLTDAQADAFTIADNKLHDVSKFDLGDLAALTKEMDREMSLLAGFNDDDLKRLADLESALSDANHVATNAKKVTFYAGDDDNSDARVAANDRTLVIVFDTEEQLQVVRAVLRKIQAVNKQSTGQVVLDIVSRVNIAEAAAATK